MTPSSSTERQAPDDDSIWLLVQRDNRTTSFELPADGNHAIVVGSADNADIRIQGVAPIAFCLEREGHALRLTPACPEPELRVDTQKVESSVRIFGQGMVEFGNACLLLRIRDTPPTLRTDCRVAVDAELSNPFCSKEPITTSHQAATRVLEPVKVTQLSTQSIEPVGNRIAPAPVVEPTRDRVPSHICTEELRPLNVKTVEFVPVRMSDSIPPPPAAVQPTPASVRPIESISQPVTTPSPDPFRTIELAPVRPEMAAGAQELACRQFDALRETAESTAGAGPRSGQTTSLDVPVFPTQAPERLATTPSGVVASRPLRSTVVLARLGLLAKRYPVGVFGGAALGSLVILLCLVGTARLLDGQSAQKAQGLSKRAPAALALTIPTAAPKPDSGPTLARKQSQDAASVAVVEAAVTPVGVAGAIADQLQAAGPDTRGAVGHLFAGRLPEAEQAYQELATRYPGEPAFQATSRILARRNSPGCKVAGARKSSCPTVKP